MECKKMCDIEKKRQFQTPDVFLRCEMNQVYNGFIHTYNSGSSAKSTKNTATSEKPSSNKWNENYAEKSYARNGKK